MQLGQYEKVSNGEIITINAYDEFTDKCYDINNKEYDSLLIEDIDVYKYVENDIVNNHYANLNLSNIISPQDIDDMSDAKPIDTPQFYKVDQKHIDLQPKVSSVNESLSDVEQLLVLSINLSKTKNETSTYKTDITFDFDFDVHKIIQMANIQNIDKDVLAKCIYDKISKETIINAIATSLKGIDTYEYNK